MGKFDIDKDEYLVEQVRLNPEMYDPEAPNYKDLQRKVIFWNAVGAKLNRTGMDCKLRWRILRDNYKKSKRLEEKGHPDIMHALRKKNTILAKLSFLDSISSEKRILVSGSKSTEQKSNQSNLDADQQISSVANVIQIEDTRSPQFQFANVGSSDSFQIFTQIEPLQRETMQSDVVNAVQDKKSEENLILRILNNLDQNCEDEVDMFFKSMSATVKKFPPDLIVQTKRLIFQAVTDMELKHLKGRPY